MKKEVDMDRLKASLDVVSRSADLGEKLLKSDLTWFLSLNKYERARLRRGF